MRLVLYEYANSWRTYTYRIALALRCHTEPVFVLFRAALVLPPANPPLFAFFINKQQKTENAGRQEGNAKYLVEMKTLFFSCLTHWNGRTLSNPVKMPISRGGLQLATTPRKTGNVNPTFGRIVCVVTAIFHVCHA